MSVLALIWSWHRKFLKTFWFLTPITDHKDVVGCLEKQTNDSANWHLQPKGSADFAPGYIFVITFKRWWYSSLPFGLDLSQLKTKINYHQTSRDAMTKMMDENKSKVHKWSGAAARWPVRVPECILYNNGPRYSPSPLTKPLRIIIS